ncbi:MAG TPA: hypothetical protein VJ718_01910 [Candidatus Binataceae bacterium]|nr:hypothetical protein [Candidatus Binataceae bacterium]
MDFAPPISAIVNPTGWTAAIVSGRSTIHWAATAAAPLPPGEPDVGQLPPGLKQINPGSSLNGFSFQSPNPPGPANYYVHGYVDYAPFIGVTPGSNAHDAIDSRQENLPEDCPGSYGGLFDLAVVGTTKAPHAHPRAD